MGLTATRGSDTPDTAANRGLWISCTTPIPLQTTPLVRKCLNIPSGTGRVRRSWSGTNAVTDSRSPCFDEVGVGTSGAQGTPLCLEFLSTHNVRGLRGTKRDLTWRGCPCNFLCRWSFCSTTLPASKVQRAGVGPSYVCLATY